jgi:hypothetical protein
LLRLSQRRRAVQQAEGSAGYERDADRNRKMNSDTHSVPPNAFYHPDSVPSTRREALQTFDPPIRNRTDFVGI